MIKINTSNVKVYDCILYQVRWISLAVRLWTKSEREQEGHSVHYTQYSDKGWKEAIITNVKAPKGGRMWAQGWTSRNENV